MDLRQVLKPNFTLMGEDFVDIILSSDGGDIPFSDVPDAFGMTEERSGNQGNVAKTGATEIRQNSLIGFFI